MRNREVTKENLRSIHARIFLYQYEWLKKYCFESGTDQAVVVREALDMLINQKEATKMKNELTHEQMLEAIEEGKTVYLVQMAKGTDNAYDETSEPRTLLRTLSKQEALDFYETLPEWVALEEPETDLEGREKYESPVVVEVSSDTRTMIRG